MNLKKLFFILSIVISVRSLGKVPKEVKIPKIKEQLSSNTMSLPLFMRVEEYNQIQHLINLRNQQNVAAQQNTHTLFNFIINNNLMPNIEARMETIRAERQARIAELELESLQRQNLTFEVRALRAFNAALAEDIAVLDSRLDQNSLTNTSVRSILTWFGRLIGFNSPEKKIGKQSITQNMNLLQRSMIPKVDSMLSYRNNFKKSYRALVTIKE